MQMKMEKMDRLFSRRPRTLAPESTELSSVSVGASTVLCALYYACMEVALLGLPVSQLGHKLF